MNYARIVTIAYRKEAYGPESCVNTLVSPHFLSFPRYSGYRPGEMLQLGVCALLEIVWTSKLRICYFVLLIGVLEVFETNVNIPVCLFFVSETNKL